KAGKLVFGEELTFGDDNITKINNSQKIVTKIHNIHKNIKNNLGRTNTSSTINNNENKIIHESPKKRKIIKREELIVPNLFQEYSEVAYNDIINIDRNGNSNKIISPTYILIDQSIETLKKYIFVLKKGINDYIIIDYDRIYLEIESFLSKYPIFPKGMHKYRLRWFQIQYLLVLYDECLIWIRKIKNTIKNTGNTTEILENVGCPSIKRILSRICKRAIYEFFDAKRSPLVKICEGDFTISVPLNLRILAHSDKEFVDEMGEQQKRKIITCTDGWYIIKIHTVFPEMKNLENIPRNIFVCGGNWLSPNTELGHPLEIESATLDYPNLLYGFNMIRPVLNLKNFKLGFHFNPLLFRLKNLVTTSTLVVGRNGSGHSIKESKINNSIDCGGGLVFLVQIVVIHVFPMCYRELVDDANNNGCDEDNENRDGIYHYITRDEDEMNITLNIEMQEMEEKSFKIRRSSQKSNFGNLSGNDVINDSQEGDCSQGSDSSIYNNNDSNSTRRISIDSRMLVLDYWKYLELLKRSNYEASILDLIENCSILTLPSGIDIDDLATIKPGTVIRLSWMKIFRNNKKLNGDNGYSYSRLIPTKKTSLSLKKKVVGCQVFDKIINLIEKPVLVSNSESIDHISILKGGWPLNIVGLLLYIYPIEERKRGYEHCFEFKILLISPIGYKIFIRVHTTAFNDSELRMCKRVNIKLSNAISLCSSNDYRRHILFVENADFNYYERSTGLFYFNAKIPYSVFNIPYSPGTDYFSTLETQRSLSKTINDLSFYTNCRLPALFE
ncbi:hypothetical protein FG379_002477, partial [Cryptosporidium bovis]|uniref:uncharacterized protein n=1 Tax=Cryptosporidium bovis TaxID=310047 RepID=UPI003519E0C6